MLGEEIVADEDYLPEDMVDELGEPMPEEEEMPLEMEEITEEEPVEEREDSTLWLIVIIVLVAVAAIWFVYKGIKK